MSEDGEFYDKKIIGVIKRVLSRWGYSSREGFIYAILLLSPKPLKIDEISHITGLSRSSVSTSLNILIREYMVDVRKEGRIKYFSPIPAFYDKFLKQPEEHLEKEVIPLREMISKLMLETGNNNYKAKLKMILDDLKSLEKLLRHIIQIEREI